MALRQMPLKATAGAGSGSCHLQRPAPVGEHPVLTLVGRGLEQPPSFGSLHVAQPEWDQRRGYSSCLYW